MGYTVRMIPFSALEYWWYLLDARVRNVDYLVVNDGNMVAGDVLG